MAQNQRYSNYNIELLEPAAPSRQSTAPKLKPNNRTPHLTVLEKPRKTQEQVRVQTNAANKNAIKILFIAGLCLFFLGLVIYSTLKLDEINRDIASIDSSMKIAQSETVRLNMELDSMVSIDKVEDYAANTLGMSKVQDYQVVYVDLSTSDRALMVGGKEVDQTKVINQENK